MRRGLAIGLIIFAILGGIGVGMAAYDAGVDDGLAQGLVEAGSDVEVVRVLDRDRHHGGFGFFLFPLFIIGTILLVKGLFWRRHGHHHDHRDGGPDGGSHGAPARFEEWHRRLHEQGQGSTPAGGAPA